MEVILTIIVVILTVAVAVLSIYTLFFYKEQRQTKIICAISIILSVIAILCSIRISPFKISDIAAFIGVISGVMALPTAVVVGWNIFTALDLKKDWKDLERKTTKEINQFKEERSKLQEYVKANRNYAIGITNSTNGRYGTAVGFLCSAAVKLNKINETETVKDCLDIISNTIEDHKNGMGDISYLEAIYKEIKIDFKRIKDERIGAISEKIEEIFSAGNKNNSVQSKTANKEMKIKYIVKDMASKEMQFLVRDVEMSNGQIASFAFLNCEHKDYSAAKFNTKDEAIAAYEEARQYGGCYTPVILETLVQENETR